MEPDPEIEELRKKLVGVKWRDLIQGASIVRNGDVFIGRFGSILRKNVVAVFCKGKFIAITQVPSYNQNGVVIKDRYLLDPKNPNSGQEIYHAAFALEKEGIFDVITFERVK